MGLRLTVGPNSRCSPPNSSPRCHCAAWETEEAWNKLVFSCTYSSLSPISQNSLFIFIWFTTAAALFELEHTLCWPNRYTPLLGRFLAEELWMWPFDPSLWKSRNFLSDTSTLVWLSVANLSLWHWIWVLFVPLSRVKAAAPNPPRLKWVCFVSVNGDILLECII